jgi:hypothetical protein
MRRTGKFEMDAKTIAEKAAAARLRIGEARTTQERQHFEGMARYWEEILEELSTASGSSEDLP